MEIFLKAKHWQIFSITFGLPFILEIATVFFMISGDNPMILMKIMPVMMVLIIGGLWGWFWAVAVVLQNKIPAEVKMKVGKFKVFFFIPLIYMAFVFGFLGTIINGIVQNGLEPGVSVMKGLMIFIIPMHLFSMFCIFYSLYFVDKTFKTVELQREVRFSDFAGEFFLIWFFPIGIWIVQPKLNKMIEMYAEKK